MEEAVSATAHMKEWVSVVDESACVTIPDKPESDDVIYTRNKNDKTIVIFF